MITRRALLALLGLLRRSDVRIRAGHLVAQRQAAAARQAVGPARSTRASPTSRKQAGLTHPIIYGGVDTQALHPRSRRLRRRVPRLRQRRLARHLRAERHAPRRRAGRRDQSPVQEQSRRHVHRRHREGRADAHRLGVRRHRRRLRQRRLRRPVHHLLRPERALSQQRRRHVHRRHREGRPAPATACATASGCTWVDYDRDGHLDLFVANYLDFDARASCPSRARTPTATGRAFRSTAVRAACRPGSSSCSATTATARSPTSARQSGIGAGVGALSDDRRRRRLRQRRLARHLRRLRLHAELAVPQPARRHVPRGRRSNAASRSAKTAWSRPAWASASATTTSTATSTSSRRTSPTTPTCCIATTARATSTT